MTDDFHTRLGRLDACAVSDALDQLGLPPSVTGLVPLSARTRVHGRVVTVRLVAGAAPADAPPRHLCTLAIEHAVAGDVVVVEHRSGVECAGWGGILSNAAHVKKLSGVIVDGFARDIDEAADMHFPIYARGGTARTARGRIHEESVGAPILIGHVTVETGDYVVADSSGVAFVPATEIATLLDAAERIVAREGQMTKAVLAGHSVAHVMGGDYERLLERNPKHD